MASSLVHVNGVLLFFSVLYIYKATSFPSVPGGDSGELLAESCHLSCAHPPGYPLFVIIIHQAMKLLSGLDGGTGLSSPAQVANFMNCLFGSLSALFVYYCVVLWNECKHKPNKEKETRYDEEKAYSIGSGIVAACFYAFSPLVWEYNIGAEVFALNNLLVSMMLYFTIMVYKSSPTCHENGNNTYYVILNACLGGFVCGSALANQHASILFIMPLMVSVALKLWQNSTNNTLLWLQWMTLCMITFLAGLMLPYAYMVVLYNRNGPKEGSWGDLSNIHGVLRHVLRMEYGTFKMLTFSNKDSSSSTSKKNTEVESAFERVMIHFNDLLNNQIFYIGVFFFGVSLIFILKTLTIKWFKYVVNDIKMTTSSPSNQTKVKKSNSLKKSSKAKVKYNVSLNGETDTEAVETVVSSFDLSVYESVSLLLVITLLFYIVIWNSVLSNLKLSVPMAYAVHSRFWIQPNLLICILVGDGACRFFTFMGFCGSRLFSSKQGNKVGNSSVISVHQKDIQSKKHVASGDQKKKSEVDEKKEQVTGFPCTSFFFLSLSVLIAAWHCEKNYQVSNQRKDSHGWTMHRYGEASLAVLPKGALLLSHTDLDWNSVRYLRVCEKQRSDVVHLSVQLLPYPWFDKQHALYQGVSFPPLPALVSTHKLDEGNSQLIENFILANYEKFGGSHDDGKTLSMEGEKVDQNMIKNTSGGGGIFIDMQAISENMIGSRGAWRSLVLVPHGNLFRVYKQPSYSKEELQRVAAASTRDGGVSGETSRALGLELSFHWSKQSLNSLEVMKEAWSRHHEVSSSLSYQVVTAQHYSIPSLTRFESGSWEFAALSVYWDAHYQLALYLLTYALDLAEGISLPELPQFAFALSKSVELLDEVVLNALGLSFDADYLLTDSFGKKKRMHTLSSSKRDVLKNCALAHVRYQSAISIFNQNAELLNMLDDSMKSIVLDELRNLKTTTKSLNAVQLFIASYPQDKDINIFKSAVEKYKSIVTKAY